MSDSKHTCVNQSDCEGMMAARDRAICEQAGIIHELRQKVDELLSELADVKEERDTLERLLDQVRE